MTLDAVAKAEDNLDKVFCEAFDTNHPAMLDWAKIKFELKRLRLHAEEVREKALEDAMRVALEEQVEVKDEDESDEAYNLGITHAVQAIRSLKSRKEGV